MVNHIGVPNFRYHGSSYRFFGSKSHSSLTWNDTRQFSKDVGKFVFYSYMVGDRNVTDFRYMSMTKHTIDECIDSIIPSFQQ